MKAKVNKNNIKSFFEGNIRYQLFYSKFAFLIPKYIREQIQYRINSMELKCYEDGVCHLCGCDTTALQMANKACDKPCYPVLQTKENWNYMLSGGMLLEKRTNIIWKLDKDRLTFKRIHKT